MKIPQSELHFTFSRSSGAGGQNVNKVNSKVTLTWNIDESSSVSDEVRERFKKKYARLIVAGLVQIYSQKHRSQKMNIDDCIAKLESYLANVLAAPKVRKKTKPTLASKLKRLESKMKRGKVKRLRGERF